METYLHVHAELSRFGRRLVKGFDRFHTNNLIATQLSLRFPYQVTELIYHWESTKWYCIRCCKVHLWKVYFGNERTDCFEVSYLFIMWGVCSLIIVWCINNDKVLYTGSTEMLQLISSVSLCYVWVLEFNSISKLYVKLSYFTINTTIPASEITTLRQVCKPIDKIVNE